MRKKASSQPASILGRVVSRDNFTFYIGGYQPAQKWLKDRKGRALSFDDVKHYQRILKILAETDRIMGTIEMDLAT